jgi:hypothetical protein
LFRNFLRQINFCEFSQKAKKLVDLSEEVWKIEEWNKRIFQSKRFPHPQRKSNPSNMFM